MNQLLKIAIRSYNEMRGNRQPAQRAALASMAGAIAIVTPDGHSVLLSVEMAEKIAGEMAKSCRLAQMIPQDQAQL